MSGSARSTRTPRPSCAPRLPRLSQEAGGQLSGFVLDLRNDAGGLLDAAVEVAERISRSRHGGDDPRPRPRRKPGLRCAAQRRPDPRGRLLVVLINGASASASEIVAGALQDNQRATIVGTHSFGKGSVQSIIPIEGHGALRLTTALYYTPSGGSIQGQRHHPRPGRQPCPRRQQVANAVMTYESDLFGTMKPTGRAGAEARRPPRGRQAAGRRGGRPPDQSESHRHAAGRPAQRRARLSAPPPPGAAVRTVRREGQ